MPRHDPPPTIDSYPEEIGRLQRRPCRRAACRKCQAPTTVAYVDPDTSRGWPTCLECARRAVPCCDCGDTTPTYSNSWSVAEHAHVRKHESGAECQAINIRARYRLPCSSCGSVMEFRLLAAHAVFHCGVRDVLECSGCGAHWKLEATSKRGNVYLAEVA